MNKKLLICGAIATALLLSACVKKETPTEDENTKVGQVETRTTTEPKFENLPAAEPAVDLVNEGQRPVEVIREETANTTTVIRREVREVQPEATPRPEPKPQPKPEPRPEPKPKPEVKAEPKPQPKPEVKPEPKPQVAPEPRSSNTEAQSQDDAVAAAIAAATPALD